VTWITNLNEFMGLYSANLKVPIRCPDKEVATIFAIGLQNEQLKFSCVIFHCLCLLTYSTDRFHFLKAQQNLARTTSILLCNLFELP
jgi:hypothetical protein